MDVTPLIPEGLQRIEAYGDGASALRVCAMKARSLCFLTKRWFGQTLVLKA